MEAEVEGDKPQVNNCLQKTDVRNSGELSEKARKFCYYV